MLPHLLQGGRKNIRRIRILSVWCKNDVFKSAGLSGMLKSLAKQQSLTAAKNGIRYRLTYDRLMPDDEYNQFINAYCSTLAGI